MIRLIIIAILGYLIFLVLRMALRMSDLVRKTRDADRKIREHQGGEMAEDPVCHTYIPKNNAVRKTVDGEIHYFCSTKCAEAFSGN